MSTITRTLKSASKTTRNNTRPDDITFKREKLKTLLITKFVKKFNCPKHEKLITAEVTSFIKKDKLTDSDLKIFEEKLKKILDEKEKLLTKYDYTSNDKNKKDDDLAREDDAADQSAMTNNFLKESKSKLGDMIDYETITNFELRKQLESERRPLTREKFDQFGDEWTAIEKYKNEIFKTQMKKEKQDDKNKKVNTRENLNEQVKTKEIYKSLEKECDMNHHKVLMKNVRILEIEEMKKQRELEEKKKLEKEIRDKQIQENKMIKTTEFVNSRNFDKKLLDEIERQNQIQREKEIQNKIQAKKNLQEMLRENDELKAKQKHEAIKERESDIKYMNDYTKLLDKHEKEREDYFKRCASRQNEFMKRMAETVIKEQDEKAKEDERKMLKYQEEKNKKDEEEELRRKQYLKDSKVNMRGYLNQQVEEKKQVAQMEKKTQEEQLQMWNKENTEYFKKENETNERMKQINKLYAEFLKSQMNKNKNSRYQTMTDEEYRLNREILDEISSPGKSKRNFFI